MSNAGKVKVGSAALIERTMASLKAWRADPKGKHACPSCGAAGIVITDRSSRPVAEWYHFHCTACGLDDALCIPMTTHRPLL